jgi:hypothetical protein
VNEPWVRQQRSVLPPRTNASENCLEVMGEGSGTSADMTAMTPLSSENCLEVMGEGSGTSADMTPLSELTIGTGQVGNRVHCGRHGQLAAAIVQNPRRSGNGCR